MSAYRQPAMTRAIVLDHDSATPLYRQIATGIRSLIARGTVQDGDSLPSVRALGENLGVNLNTVAKAYRVLSEEGVVDLRHGASARVIAPPVPDEAELDRAASAQLIDAVGRLRVKGTAAAAVREVFEDAMTRFYSDEEGEGR